MLMTNKILKGSAVTVVEIQDLAPKFEQKVCMSKLFVEKHFYEVIPKTGSP